MLLDQRFSLQKILFVLISLVLFITLIYFHFKGITFYDEGYILNAALRTLHGEIPYKDFDIVYTPLSFVITSVFLAVFGESVFAGRLAALVVSLFSLVAIYYLLKQFTKNKLLICGSLVFFVSWGPSHINFPWPTMFALCFFLYATLFYVLGIQKGSQKYFFLAGVMTMLVLLSKQNFGAGTLLILTLAFFFLRIQNKITLFIRYSLGVVLVSAIYVVYLVATGSFVPFLQNMDLYTFQRVFVDKSLETPFLYEGAWYARIVKLIFYTLPLLFSVAAFLVLNKTSKKYILIPIITAMFYLLGVRPTTDYVHVVSLVALSILPLSLCIIFTKNIVVKYSLVSVLIFMTAIGFYTAYLKGYYQWEPSLKESNSFVANQRIKIYLSEQQAKETDALVGYIKNNTNNNEFIFVNYYAPMIYFISDRKNPTPYDLISTNQLPITYQKSITNLLKEKQVKLIVNHSMNEAENGIVTQYIRKNYNVTQRIGGYIIYEKNR